MDPVKIAGIKNWKTPEKVKDICSFLGFCNFYRAFIKGFSFMARSLNTLTKKDQVWQWTPSTPESEEGLSLAAEQTKYRHRVDSRSSLEG